MAPSTSPPPFGLPKFFADPRKQLPFSGVFSLREGKLQLLTTELTGPNGIAFPPDERYQSHPDGTVSNGEVFFDMTSAPGEDSLDGMQVDRRGNLYVSGPGGLWILSPEGKHLGTVIAPMHPHNTAWGDDDGKPSTSAPAPASTRCARDPRHPPVR